ncbi:hypothetical protein F4W05_13160 [Ewingella americana]|uniref:Phage abortive infection protein n=1 Tax=Ewingella americana TaxID=41202 RepID=A0A377N757_9GAMM|nr:hypothetical protein [Ewingella americana]KAA8727565.1 hypothetical protein F4W05_13160 [Ewingella americana]STQ42843.1 Uncharacterised protein [Ewingella americana]
MKLILWLIIPIAILFAITPLLIYFHTFNSRLSSNPQDWGAFGSYLGGVYSTLFGSLSVFALLLTLNEMKKANIQERKHFQHQMANSKAEKTLQDVIQLTEMIHKLIDVNPTIGNKKHLPYALAATMEELCKKSQVTDEEELYYVAIDLMRAQKSRFSSEIHVLAQLTKKIASIEDDEQAETAKAIVKGLISESYRFWLYCYARVWNMEAKHYLRKWPDFETIPSELERFIPDPYDYQDDQ